MIAGHDSMLQPDGSLHPNWRRPSDPSSWRKGTLLNVLQLRAASVGAMVVAAGAVVNVVSTVSLVLLNKWIYEVDGFKFMITNWSLYSARRTPSGREVRTVRMPAGASLFTRKSSMSDLRLAPSSMPEGWVQSCCWGSRCSM